MLQRVRSLEDEMERLRGAASDNRARTISSGSGNDPGETQHPCVSDHLRFHLSSQRLKIHRKGTDIKFPNLCFIYFLSSRCR